MSGIVQQLANNTMAKSNKHLKLHSNNFLLDKLIPEVLKKSNSPFQKIVMFFLNDGGAGGGVGYTHYNFKKSQKTHQVA